VKIRGRPGDANKKSTFMNMAGAFFRQLIQKQRKTAEKNELFAFSSLMSCTG
jgi:hypothetical protein